MWSDRDWSLLHIKAERVWDGLVKAGYHPTMIINRKPVFDHPVDWQQVQTIVEGLIKGVEPTRVKSNPVASVEENAKEQAPQPSKPSAKKGRSRGRPKKAS